MTEISKDWLNEKFNNMIKSQESTKEHLSNKVDKVESNVKDIRRDFEGYRERTGKRLGDLEMADVTLENKLDNETEKIHNRINWRWRAFLTACSVALVLFGILYKIQFWR